jgi:hypothetical protein
MNVHTGKGFMDTIGQLVKHEAITSSGTSYISTLWLKPSVRIEQNIFSTKKKD